MNEITKVIEKGERTLWSGKPKFLPYMIGSLSLILFGLMFLIPGIIPLYQGLKTGNIFLFIFPHFWLGFVLVFFVPLYMYFSYKYIHYAITNKRVIFQSGLIGRDFEIVDFDKITNAEVNVGILDKLFGGGSGTILIFTAGTFTHTRRGVASKPYRLRHVPDPYEVFKYLKKVSHDVKTDIHFPNKYRPKENPGYGTDLKH